MTCQSYHKRSSTLIQSLPEVLIQQVNSDETLVLNDPPSSSILLFVAAWS
jgi:hypothetical protein